MIETAVDQDMLLKDRRCSSDTYNTTEDQELNPVVGVAMSTDPQPFQTSAPQMDNSTSPNVELVVHQSDSDSAETICSHEDEYKSVHSASFSTIPSLSRSNSESVLNDMIESFQSTTLTPENGADSVQKNADGSMNGNQCGFQLSGVNEVQNPGPCFGQPNEMNGINASIYKTASKELPQSISLSAAYPYKSTSFGVSRSSSTDQREEKCILYSSVDIHSV